MNDKENMDTTTARSLGAKAFSKGLGRSPSRSCELMEHPYCRQAPVPTLHGLFEAYEEGFDNAEEDAYDKKMEAADIKRFDVYIYDATGRLRPSFVSREEALQCARLNRDRLRAAYEEEVDSPYVDEYRGLTLLMTEEEWEKRCHKGWPTSCGWLIEVHDQFPPSRLRVASVIWRAREGANRAALPDSKVFLSIGGRDCDGYKWCEVSEHSSLMDAHYSVESAMESADGPTGWSVISKEAYEAF